MIAPDVSITEPETNWEIRRCQGCGREGIRPARESRAAEVPCTTCACKSFSIFRVVLVAQDDRIAGIPLTLTEDELLALLELAAKNTPDLSLWKKLRVAQVAAFAQTNGSRS